MCKDMIFDTSEIQQIFSVINNVGIATFKPSFSTVKAQCIPEMAVFCQNVFLGICPRQQRNLFATFFSVFIQYPGGLIMEMTQCFLPTFFVLPLLKIQ